MLNAVKAEFEQELALDKLKQELMPQTPPARREPPDRRDAIHPGRHLIPRAAQIFQSAIEQLKASSPQRGLGGR
jgi:hypothetical protein